MWFVYVNLLCQNLLRKWKWEQETYRFDAVNQSTDCVANSVNESNLSDVRAHHQVCGVYRCQVIRITDSPSTAADSLERSISKCSSTSIYQCGHLIVRHIYQTTQHDTFQSIIPQKQFLVTTALAEVKALTC